MHPILKQFDQHLKEHPIFQEGESAESIMDLLYSYFAESSRFNNEAIKNGFAEIRVRCATLTPKQIDDLIDTVCMLCHEHERLAFIEGLRVGLQTYRELS